MQSASARSVREKLVAFFVLIFLFKAGVSFCPTPTVLRTTSLSLVNKKDLSASERERRDEEDRRRKRKDDVVIGKTSAIKGEKDFVIDPKTTEQEYFRQLSSIEREVFQLTEAGMEFLNLLQLEEADRAFSRVFELKPNAYLWQAGIVKFYLGDVPAAAKIFAEAAETCETRFSTPSSEERIWRDACELKYLSSISKERKRELKETHRISAIIPTIKSIDDGDKLLGTESRKVVRVTRDLFSSSCDSDMSGELLARAKLRSIGGTEKSPKMDRKMWKLTSWFYLGLHYDSLGCFDESKKCMKMALKFGPSTGKSDDIIHTLPLLHMTVRDWFDDDDFDEDVVFGDEMNSEEDAFSPTPPDQAVAGMAYADPLIERSIKEGVSKMKLRELKEALRLREKTTTGSKEQLQERLFYSLMDDAGFASGFAP